MEAKIGDHVVVEGPQVGVPSRRGEIVEVIHGSQGDHYRVRWESDDHESVFFPSSDAHIERRSR